MNTQNPRDNWEEPQLLASLRELQASVRQLTDVVDSNLSLLEDSVREVRTARQIAAESNRLARRRLLREGGSPALMVASNLPTSGSRRPSPARRRK